MQSFDCEPALLRMLWAPPEPGGTCWATVGRLPGLRCNEGAGMEVLNLRAHLSSKPQPAQNTRHHVRLDLAIVPTQRPVNLIPQGIVSWVQPYPRRCR